MVQQKKKVRFNFIDALIVLLILAVIGAAVYLVLNDFRTPKILGSGNLDFEVRISEVDETSLEMIQKGLTVKDSVTGEVIGTIVNVQKTPSRYYSKTAIEKDGVYTLSVSEYEDVYDVTVTINTTAAKDARGIHQIGNTRILVGSKVYFKIPSFTSVSYITKVSTSNPG